MKKCSICGKPFKGFGHIADHINDGLCCDVCNETIVFPARVKMFHDNKE